MSLLKAAELTKEILGPVVSERSGEDDREEFRDEVREVREDVSEEVSLEYRSNSSVSISLSTYLFFCFLSFLVRYRFDGREKEFRIRNNG